jgi:hypothetical protein
MPKRVLGVNLNARKGFDLPEQLYFSLRYDNNIKYLLFLFKYKGYQNVVSNL